MEKFQLVLSDNEIRTLRCLALEQRQTMAELIRTAIDTAYGTDSDEIPPPGRRPGKEAK